MTKITVITGDNDWLTISGLLSYVPTINTGTRFNSFQKQSSTGVTLDEFQVTRYFPISGTYRVKVIYPRNTGDGCDMNVGFDGDANAIFSLITQDDDTSSDNEKFTTMQVSRGFHNITLQAVASGTGSGLYFQALFFELIAPHDISDESPAPQNAGGSIDTDIGEIGVVMI